MPRKNLYDMSVGNVPRPIGGSSRIEEDPHKYIVEDPGWHWGGWGDLPNPYQYHGSDMMAGPTGGGWGPYDETYLNWMAEYGFDFGQQATDWDAYNQAVLDWTTGTTEWQSTYDQLLEDWSPGGWGPGTPEYDNWLEAFNNWFYGEYGTMEQFGEDPTGTMWGGDYWLEGNNPWYYGMEEGDFGYEYSPNAPLFGEGDYAEYLAGQLNLTEQGPGGAIGGAGDFGAGSTFMGGNMPFEFGQWDYNCATQGPSFNSAGECIACCEGSEVPPDDTLDPDAGDECWEAYLASGYSISTPYAEWAAENC